MGDRERLSFDVLHQNIDVDVGITAESMLKTAPHEFALSKPTQLFAFGLGLAGNVGFSAFVILAASAGADVNEIAANAIPIAPTIHFARSRAIVLPSPMNAELMQAAYHQLIRSQTRVHRRPHHSSDVVFDAVSKGLAPSLDEF